MNKIIKVIYITIISILLFSNIVFANLEEDNEAIEVLELNKEVIETSAELSSEPIINSRAAIILDRNSKKAIYNKKNGRKKTNGVNY